MLKKLLETICLFCWKYQSKAISLSIGFIFIWFGLLKCFDVSPAAELVQHALPKTDNHFYVRLIGFWEVLIGVSFCFKYSLKLGLFLFFLHVPGTFLPLIFSPQACFAGSPFLLTLEGQYIFKNFVLVAACFNLLGSLRKDSKDQ